MARIARAQLPVLKKTASYYVLHMLVASMVAYAVMRDVVMAATLSLLEPTVQAVAFLFHEKAWQWRARRSGGAPAPAAA